MDKVEQLLGKRLASMTIEELQRAYVQSIADVELSALLSAEISKRQADVRVTFKQDRRQAKPA